ncbi:DUF2225 domain-containing protein [Paenibacillus sp. NEAU-GSW1]|uniref:DUF2225 domain-containing protein n=1 Tax=Paenibacillus sp. NEAU-GSW1 TaxID=2682486 RepID=UPI0012E2A49F|nr:DUF2225 domain-containing protein [Paenibacillus sp. NEAU-GSW1]MUT68036.1 DUF2225 domain-containing protein [Paenibacillus sp. NEAU-GSW1]
MEPLYQTNVNCICCEMPFSTSRVRPSFKKAISTDTDFCGHYKNGVNPDYYVVRVCPACGFASTENGMQRLTENQKKLYFDKVGVKWTTRDYGGERELPQALACYKLALLTAQVTGEKDRVVAGILHHIAWLYRYEGNQEEEKRFLRFALNSYIKVYETEGEDLNNVRLMYMLGELNNRIGERNEAVKWFSRIVNDKRIMDAAMIRASREQWQAIREEMAAERMGLDDSNEPAEAGRTAAN